VLRLGSSKPVIEMVPAQSSAKADDPAPAAAEMPPALPRRILTPRTAAALGIALVAITGIAAVVRFVGSRPAASTSNAQTVRFRVAIPEGMQLSGSQTFSLSPDGRKLVYLARAAGGPLRLWAQSLDSLEPRVLPGADTGSDAPVFWSPDSKFVVFYGSEKLQKIDFSGNPPQVICPAPSTVLGGSWNRDGTIIFGTETPGIMVVAANSGKAVPLAARNAARGERVVGWPTFLPDGRHFLYSRLSSIPGKSGAFVGSLESKPDEQDPKQLVATPFSAQFVASANVNGTVLFQREATLWAQAFDTSRLQLTGEAKPVAEHLGGFRAFGFFSSSPAGTLVHRNAVATIGQLYWFDRRGERVAAVGQPYDFWDAGPVLSPEGTRIAAAKFEAENVDIWVNDLARDVSQRITFDPAIDEVPIWAPDGKRLVFRSGRAGHYDLYQIGAGGEGREELLYASSQNKYATSWSADGRYLLFTT